MRGNIHRDVEKTDAFAIFDVYATAPSPYPSQRPVRQQHAILHRVFTLGLDRALQGGVAHCTIVWMHAREQCRVIQASLRSKTKEPASLVRHPTFIFSHLPNPEAQAWAIHVEDNPLLTLSQIIRELAS